MKKLWIGFTFVLFVSFLVLGWIGTRIYEGAPPIPEKVITTQGHVVIDVGVIQAGQNVWQSLGGMEVGSIWGHGSYVAPDWTADWLHRESVFIVNRWANAEYSKDFDLLDEGQQGQLIGRLTNLMRTNTWDSESQTVTVDPIRAEAFESNLAHYSCFLKRQHTLCNSGWSGNGRSSSASVISVLLLDFMGRINQSTRRPYQLHEQLALRAFGFERTSASLCCSPESLRWLVSAESPACRLDADLSFCGQRLLVRSQQ